MIRMAAALLMFCAIATGCAFNVGPNSDGWLHLAVEDPACIDVRGFGWGVTVGKCEASDTPDAANVDPERSSGG